MTDPRPADPASLLPADGVPEPTAEGPTAHSEPTDPGSAPESAASGQTPESAASAPTAAGPTPSDIALQRRAFVRRMGSDAVRTAGTMFGLSRMLTRGAAAAGQTVIGELERLQAPADAGGDVASADASVLAAPVSVSPGPILSPDEGATTVAPASDLLAVATGAIASREPAWTQSAVAVAAATTVAPVEPPTPPPAATSAPARPAITLDDEQRAILESATTAVIAVNRTGHPPQLTSAAILWDGETLRFLTLGWSRRTTMLRSDPLVGAFVDGPFGSSSFVTVAGRARIAEGRDAREHAWPLLLRETGGDEEQAAARWLTLLAEDVDRAVIVIEPDQVLTGRR